MQTRATIVSNLKSHHGKWVNTACALHNIDLSIDTKDVLNGLIQEGNVCRKVQVKQGQNLTWYRWDSLGR